MAVAAVVAAVLGLGVGLLVVTVGWLLVVLRSGRLVVVLLLGLVVVTMAVRGLCIRIVVTVWLVVD